VLTLITSQPSWVFAGKFGRLGRGDKISSPRMLKRKAGELLLREIKMATAEERGVKCLELALDSP